MSGIVKLRQINMLSGTLRLEFGVDVSSGEKIKINTYTYEGEVVSRLLVIVVFPFIFLSSCTAIGEKRMKKGRFPFSHMDECPRSQSMT